jgi:hypothetical protein
MDTKALQAGTAIRLSGATRNAGATVQIGLDSASVTGTEVCHALPDGFDDNT